MSAAEVMGEQGGAGRAAAADRNALGLDDSMRSAVREHLRDEYAGVFGDQETDWHLQSHVGYDFADYAVAVLRSSLAERASILDIGSGYGSFVIRARQAGWLARGVEVAGFEVDIARRRLAVLRPSDDPEAVFSLADARHAGWQGGEVDCVTLWNVIEHIEDHEPVLAAAYAMLAPGGFLYIICPNYLAWRNEAHYQVPWHPGLALVSRERVCAYLAGLGRDPRFFATSIFRRTNHGVQRSLRRLGMELYDLNGYLPLGWKPSRLARQVRYAGRLLGHWNPFRPSVELLARKPGAAA